MFECVLYGEGYQDRYTYCIFPVMLDKVFKVVFGGVLLCFHKMFCMSISVCCGIKCGWRVTLADVSLFVASVGCWRFGFWVNGLRGRRSVRVERFFGVGYVNGVVAPDYYVD